MLRANKGRFIYLMPTPCHTTITNLDDGHMYSNEAKQATYHLQRNLVN